jgi:Sec-independent protein translocase protein TatA
MFALSGGELAMVALIFALVWGSGVLPRVGERLGARFAERRRAPKSIERPGP